MKNLSIKKTIAAALTAATLLGVLPMAASAATKTGWIEKGSDWYYVTASGSYKTGWMQDNTSVWYYFNSNGVMQKNTTITTNGYNYKLDSDGAWIGSITTSSAKGVVSGATYKLINVGSGKALDVDSAGTNNYTNVSIYDDNNTGAQKWTIYELPDGTYKLINTNSMKALDVYAAEKDDYSNVDIYTENGTGAQKWKIFAGYDGTYKLINANSGKALDVYAAGTANYTNVDVYTDNGTNAQKWNLVRIG